MTGHRITVGLSLLNLAMLVAAAGPARPEGSRDPAVLRGSALELVDQRGKARATIRVESSGEVVLRLFDQRGTIRVKLGAGTEGSGLVLNNDATEPGVHLLAKPEGSSVRVTNKDGHQRVVAP
ncbi:MAG TPA: hypothetical protein VH680_14320 [Gemmatimonadales bacterium]|jgi:hypothetical protein